MKNIRCLDHINFRNLHSFNERDDDDECNENKNEKIQNFSKKDEFNVDF